MSTLSMVALLVTVPLAFRPACTSAAVATGNRKNGTPQETSCALPCHVASDVARQPDEFPSVPVVMATAAPLAASRMP
jgi:hypothetical protein